MKKLSTGGKLTLIRSTICSLPLYMLAVLKPPLSVINKIQNLLAHFLWDSVLDSKHFWVSVQKMFTAVERGGLGLAFAHTVMKAQHARLAWQYIKGGSL